MKITAIRATPVTIPMDIPFFWSVGLYPGTSKTIIEVEDDVIEEGPFRQTNNVIQVPEGPGLGVTLSPKALKRCHDRFVNEGPIHHFYDPNCPDRLRRLPLD